MSHWLIWALLLLPSFRHKFYALAGSTHQLMIFLIIKQYNTTFMYVLWICGNSLWSAFVIKSVTHILPIVLLRREVDIFPTKTHICIHIYLYMYVSDFVLFHINFNLDFSLVFDIFIYLCYIQIYNLNHNYWQKMKT